MKHIFFPLFTLLHLLPGALAAAEGAFATAAEFGAPRLNLDPVQYFTPSEVRTWPHAFMKPGTGRLVGLNPYSTPLHGMLERPDGTIVTTALMMTDDDVKAVVDKWKAVCYNHNPGGWLKKPEWEEKFHRDWNISRFSMNKMEKTPERSAAHDRHQTRRKRR